MNYLKMENRKLILRKYSTILSGACLVLFAAAGCQPGVKDRYAPVIQSPQRIHRELLGYSVQQRPIELLTAGDGSQVVLVMAAIHGNEDAGTPLVYELLDALRQRPHLLDGRTVLIVPVANPDGRAARTRGNAIHVDLNRNFPAANRVNSDIYGHDGLSEPESRILHELIVSRKPVRIVTLHQPLDCLDYDGAAEDIADFMGMYCRLPIKKLGALPGSLGSFAGLEQNIPIVTMELKKSDSDLSANQLWTNYGPALLAFITYPQSPY